MLFSWWKAVGSVKYVKFKVKNYWSVAPTWTPFPASAIRSPCVWRTSASSSKHSLTRESKTSTSRPNVPWAKSPRFLNIKMIRLPVDDGKKRPRPHIDNNRVINADDRGWPWNNFSSSRFESVWSMKAEESYPFTIASNWGVGLSPYIVWCELGLPNAQALRTLPRSWKAFETFVAESPNFASTWCLSLRNLRKSIEGEPTWWLIDEKADLGACLHIWHEAVPSLNYKFPA